MRRVSLAVVTVLLSVLLASCATKTPETITVTEVVYKPIELDISDSVEMLFDARPPLAPDLTVDDGATVLQKATLYALSYKEWGESWQEYSMRLEDYVVLLQRTLMNPEASVPPAE